MNNQILNNGQVLMEKNNLIHLRNAAGNQMVFEVVDIDHGYVVLEPLDYRKFNGDPNKLDSFLTGKPILKGVITTVPK